MAEQVNRDFKGVWIPKEVWVADDLGWSEKVLLVELFSLDNEQGCFASNDYLADFLKLSKDRISKMISTLKKKGYVTVDLLYKEGTKQIEKRIIRIVKTRYYGIDTPMVENADTPRRKQLEGLVENNYTPIGENAKDNNTVINNTFNNTESKREGDKPLPPSPVIDESFKKVIEHFETHVIYEKVSYTHAMRLEGMMNEYDGELIIKAMEIAVERGKPHLQYINGILRTWRAEGIINVQQLGGMQNATNRGSNSRINTENAIEKPRVFGNYCSD